MARENFLKKVKEEKTRVKVFLDNKTMLSGLIKDFDETCIIIDECLVYNHQTISITIE